MGKDVDKSKGFPGDSANKLIASLRGILQDTRNPSYDLFTAAGGLMGYFVIDGESVQPVAKILIGSVLGRGVAFYLRTFAQRRRSAPFSAVYPHTILGLLLPLVFQSMAEDRLQLGVVCFIGALVGFIVGQVQWHGQSRDNRPIPGPNAETQGLLDLTKKQQEDVRDDDKRA